MRILFLCHRVPYPPNKGEKIRAFHQLKALGGKHEVDLFTLADNPADLAYRSVLLEYCRRVTIESINPRFGKLKTLPYLFTKQALTIPYFYSRKLQVAVDAAISSGEYDRIFVYCSAMAQYIENAGQIPVIIDLVDVDSDKWAQYAKHARFPWSAVYKREAKRLREFEARIGESAAALLVSTAREAALIRGLKAPVHVLPNGVDTDFFKPLETLEVRQEPTIVFTGDMAYFPNQQAVEFFARDVFPLVRREVSDARFLIVGRNPSQRVKSLQSIDGIEVTGGVADVRPYLHRAQVAVAPFVIAAGIQNKILEAMSSGLPVVATVKAVQGLSGTTASLIGTGETAQELATKTSQFLKQRDYSRKVGLQGRQALMAEYSWKAAFDRLLSVTEEPSRPTIGEVFQPLGT